MIARDASGRRLAEDDEIRDMGRPDRSTWRRCAQQCGPPWAKMSSLTLAIAARCSPCYRVKMDEERDHQHTRPRPKCAEMMRVLFTMMPTDVITEYDDGRRSKCESVLRCDITMGTQREKERVFNTMMKRKRLIVEIGRRDDAIHR